MSLPRFSLLGATSLLCEAPRPLDIKWQRRLWGLEAVSRNWRFISQAVLGMNNLLLVFDPQLITPEELKQKLSDLWPNSDTNLPVGKFVEVPVVYGGEAGIDLVELAQRAGTTVREYVKRHTTPEYTTFFVGGYPGQPHLGGLHPSLVTPRRSEPRMRVPAGTVAIGGEQTTVYPSTQPGGLQLIGSTDVVFFDVERTPPSLLAPGDRVKLRALRIET